jgi:hypothetical protein
MHLWPPTLRGDAMNEPHVAECRCGEPDCAWLAAWDYAEQMLADELREQRGREAFGWETR